MRETEAEAIFDSKGQGSIWSALASFLNIGCAIFDATKAELRIHLGAMPLNCQEDISRINSTLDQVRRGAKIIGETLARKQLKSNTAKDKYLLLGSKSFTNMCGKVYVFRGP